MHKKGEPTPQEIQTIKSSYPDQPILKTKVGVKKSSTDCVLFKIIDHGIMKTIEDMARVAEEHREIMPIEEANRILIQECVLWPSLSQEELDALPVGYIPNVAKKIQEHSGFVDIDIFQRVVGPDVHVSVVKDFDYWPDITDEQEKELKETCDFMLFRARIGKWIFYIRPMTRSDVNIAAGTVDDQITIAKAITMWPKDVKWEKIPSGIIEVLGRKANQISGWDMDDTEVEEI